MKTARVPVAILVIVFTAFGSRLASISQSTGGTDKAKSAAVNDPGYDCSKDVKFPSVVINADHPQFFYYCKSAAFTSIMASPPDIPVHLKDASSLTVRLKNINPINRSCTVSFDSTGIPEIDGSVFGKVLGVPQQGNAGTAAVQEKKVGPESAPLP